MNKLLKKAWTTIEKYIIYISLSTIIILEILSWIFPDWSFLDNQGAICLFSAALIVIYQNVTELKEHSLNKLSTTYSSSFNDGLVEIFKKNEALKSLDIMASTSRTYFHSINDNNVSIEHLRLLVWNPQNPETRHYPLDSESIKAFDISRKQAIAGWKDLRNSGKIKKLEIRYYDFDPTFHFAIINNRHLHYGMYKIEKIYPGYHLYPLYTLDSKETLFSRSQLQDKQNFFNHIFEHWSYPEKTSKKTPLFHQYGGSNSEH